MFLTYPIQFRLAIEPKDIKLPGYQWPEERLEECFALTQLIENTLTKDKVILVFFPSMLNEEPFIVATTLVHEAVHVFDVMMDIYGETVIGTETRAYGVENIFAQLYEDYLKRYKKANLQKGE